MLAEIIALTAIVAAITAGSVAHGRDWVTKGLLITGTVLILAICGFWFNSWGGALVGTLAALLFWFARRNSDEAHASLSEVDFPQRSNAHLFKANRWVSLAYSAILGGLCVWQGHYLLALPVMVLPWIPNAALYFAVPSIAKASGWTRPDKRMISEAIYGVACSFEAAALILLGGAVL